MWIIKLTVVIPDGFVSVRQLYSSWKPYCITNSTKVFVDIFKMNKMYEGNKLGYVNIFEHRNGLNKSFYGFHYVLVKKNSSCFFLVPYIGRGKAFPRVSRRAHYRIGIYLASDNFLDVRKFCVFYIFFVVMKNPWVFVPSVVIR